MNNVDIVKTKNVNIIVTGIIKMARYMNDISLQHKKQNLEIELEEVNKKIKTIPEVKKIFKNTYHKNLKYWVDKYGDWQHLHLEFDIDDEDGKPNFGWDDFEKLYNLGWHVFGTDASCNVAKHRFHLIFRRNSE